MIVPGQRIAPQLHQFQSDGNLQKADASHEWDDGLDEAELVEFYEKRTVDRVDMASQPVWDL